MNKDTSKTFSSVARSTSNIIFLDCKLTFPTITVKKFFLFVRNGNRENYYLADTFNISVENLNSLSNGDPIELIKWRGSKSEFCQFVKDEYKTKKTYSNLKEAVYSLFPKYSFKDSKWTPKQCYSLIKKLG